MKIIKPSLIATIGFVVATQSANAAESLTCRVVAVDETANVWEEGLGPYGDSDVDSDSQTVVLTANRNRVESVDVGQMSWDSDDAVLRKATAGGRTIWEVQPEGTDQNLKVIVYPSARGVVLLAEGGSTYARVATIDCSSLAALEAAWMGQDNVKRMTAAQRRALPANVRGEMAKTDIPFEMGDGYYDLQWSRLYRVVDAAGETVGYLEHAYLTYTEGDDVEVVARYDRNGLRHGALE